MKNITINIYRPVEAYSIMTREKKKHNNSGRVDFSQANYEDSNHPTDIDKKPTVVIR